MIPQRPVGVDPQVRALAEQVAALSRQVRELATSPQLAYSSVEDGAIEVYDDDEVLRARIGKNPDGSFGLQHVGGGAPETPTEPDVIAVPGGAVVIWDGQFEEAQVEEVARIAVHVSETPDFLIVTDADETSDEDSTEVAAIYSPRGGSVFVALAPGFTYYVRLTAVSQGGIESAPTDAVSVVAINSEATFWQDEFVLAVDGAQELTLTHEPIPGSEHLYWNGLYQREDVAWTGLGKTVSLTGDPTTPAAGDTVVLEYAYVVDAAALLPQAFTRVAWYDAGASATIPVPAGVQVDDLVVVAVCGVVSVTDPRLTQVASGVVSSAGGPGTAEVWVGTMSDLGALAVSNAGAGAGGATAVATWLRGSDHTLIHDGRIASDGPRQGGTGAVPALAGPGSGQVLAVFGISGMYGSAVGGGTIASWPAYLEESLSTGSYWVTGIGIDHGQDGSPVAPLMVADPEDGWFVVVIGVI